MFSGWKTCFFYENLRNSKRTSFWEMKWVRECHSPTFNVLLSGEKHAKYLLTKGHVILWLLYNTIRLLWKVPRGNHDCAGRTTREMWIDLLGLTNPTRRRGRAGAYCLFLLAHRGIGYSQIVWAWFNYLDTYSNRFPTVVVKTLNV